MSAVADVGPEPRLGTGGRAVKEQAESEGSLNASNASPRLARRLSVVDGMGVTIGIMVGSGIFASPGEVVDRAGGTRLALVAWASSSLLAMLGALCFAELGAAFPHAGGNYHFLSLAYHESVGFAFVWSSFFITSTGSQAIILLVGAKYLIGGGAVPDADENGGGTYANWPGTLVAVVAVWVITGINCLGVRSGARVQNTLTALKGLLVVGVIIMGIGYAASANPGHAHNNLSADGDDDGRQGGGVGTILPFAQAMVACLWAFDGWADIAFLAEEMRNPSRSIPIVIVASVACTATLFIGVNIAYMCALSADDIASSDAVALDLARRVSPGPILAQCVAIGVAVSALGSANGSVLTGARIYYAAARDGTFPAFLSRISSRHRAPVAALLVQGVWTTLLILIPGANFSSLLSYFAVAGWFFYGATSIALIVLRWRFPDVPRPFHCPLYPFPPIAVGVVSALLVAGCVAEAPVPSLAAVGFVALSVPVYFVFYSGRSKRFEQARARVREEKMRVVLPQGRDEDHQVGIGNDDDDDEDDDDDDD